MSGALFGTPGRIIEFFPWENDQSVDHRRSLSVHDTVGGGSFAFRGKRTRRTWSLKNDDLSPEEYRDIELMMYDVHGPGPFWLIDQEARATNALTPSQSLPGLHGELSGYLGSVSASAPLEMPDGFYAPSATATGAVYFRPGVPVLPGTPMTFSIYASQGATGAIDFYSSSGSLISRAGTMFSQGSGSIRRFHRTATPPPGAATVYFTVTSSTMVAAPAVTFTSSLRPWSVGKGSSNVVVSSWERSFEVMSTLSTDRQLVSVSMEVEEVGINA